MAVVQLTPFKLLYTETFLFKNKLFKLRGQFLTKFSSFFIKKGSLSTKT